MAFWLWLLIRESVPEEERDQLLKDMMVGWLWGLALCIIVLIAWFA
jgi:hypothetical protein